MRAVQFRVATPTIVRIQPKVTSFHARTRFHQSSLSSAFNTRPLIISRTFESKFGGSGFSGSGFSGSSFNTAGGSPQQSTFAPRILRPEEVDVSKITFGELKLNANKGKYVGISYEGRPLRIQTPLMRLPFGISKQVYNDEEIGLNMSLSFDNMNENQEIASFYKVINNIDTVVKTAAKKNASSWLPSVPKDKIDANLDINYKVSVRNPPEDKDKLAPTFRVKVPVSKETKEPTIAVFGGPASSPTKMNLQDIQKGTRVMSIVELRGIYFVANMLGTTWAARQVYVAERPANFSEFAFNIPSNSSSAPSEEPSEDSQGKSQVGKKPLLFKKASDM